MKSSAEFINIFLILILTSFSVCGQSVREIKDSVGFCWNSNEMNSFIDWLENHKITEEILESENLFAAISPHDDFLYAGRIYYPIYKLIKAKEIIIFGVTHGTVRKAINDPNNILILDNFDFWKGPYGNVKVSDLREKIKSRLDAVYYTVNNYAHSLEHSIEALIPFLQYYNREIKITPIMVTKMSFERMDEIAKALAEIIFEYVKEKNQKLDEDVFILISNDANHYGEDFNNYPYGLDATAHQIATDEDKRIAAKFNGEISVNKIAEISDELWTEKNIKEFYPLWCGRYPVIEGVLTAKYLAEMTGKNLYGKLFCYSDTFTEKVLSIRGTMMGLTAPFSLRHWVGFFSAGFYLK